ncbi:hypothetical protein N9B82_04490 [Saprospiraceae bacterium]|nr:hypothetical protein [Saprospiraceae bacterium]
MKNIALSLLCTFLSLGLWSQEEYIFNSQESIDQFLIDNPDLTVLDGSLHIEHTEKTPITNLDGFINLTEVVSSITIRDNSFLENLSGLDNVYITPFNSGTSMEIMIFNNNSLSDISALTNKFTSLLNVHLNLGINPEIIDLNDLHNLETVGKLTLFGMNGLENLEGLSNLTAIAGLGEEQSLQFMFNENLESLEGLTSLENVTGPMEILNNDVLTSLDGLENVVFSIDIPEVFLIAENDLLTDISALSLENVGSMGFGIVNNKNLECCSTDFLCDDLSIPSDLIFGNAIGCRAKAEVLENCGLECGLINAFEEEEYADIAKIHPNPAVNQLRITASQPVEVQILDCTGNSI